MKKLLLSLYLATVAIAAQAQVTLEKHYNGYLEAVKMAGGVKYYTPDYTPQNTLRVYNQDHSIYKSIAVPTVAGYALEYVYGVSDKLINLDGALEYVAYYRNAPGSTDSKVDVIRIWSETGAQVAAVDTADYADFYNTPQGTKMVVHGSYYDAATTNNINVSRVFAVGGAFTPLKTANAKADDAFQPFPNPTSSFITLPYKVSGNEVATLTVYDLAGRQVKAFKVDEHTNHLSLDAGSLPPATYVYRLSTSTETTPGRKFVVTR